MRKILKSIWFYLVSAFFIVIILYLLGGNPEIIRPIIPNAFYYSNEEYAGTFAITSNNKD